MLFAVTNRRSRGATFLAEPAPVLTYLSGQGLAERGAPAFRRALLAELRARVAAGAQPVIVMVLHGYNNGWDEARELFERIEVGLRPSDQPAPDGWAEAPGPVVVGFSWPSEGRLAGYLDDRGAARASAEPLARLLLDAMSFLDQERCPARLAILAHSMGSYLLSLACSLAWELKGRPSDFNVLAEAVMIAPDLDANVFEPGNTAGPIAALARRVTVYYSRHDEALLASSAKRAGVTGARLGRQGPDPLRMPNNVVAVDASAYVTPGAPGGSHSAYFYVPTVIKDLQAVFAGVDRDEVTTRTKRSPGSYAIA